MSHNMPHPHQFVYFCIMTQQNTDGSNRLNLSFSWVIAPKPYVSPPKLTHERHILGMSTSPEIIPFARNFAVWAVPL